MPVASVADHMTDFNNAVQGRYLGLIHLVLLYQIGIVAKVPQEPVQFPQGFCVAIQATRNDVVAKPVRFENGQVHEVIRLRSVFAKLDSLDADQEDPIWDLAASGDISSA
jgi:hypothetical protein